MENFVDADVVEVPSVMETSVSLLARAEIDTQITTARAFPRSIRKFMDRAISMATISVEVAEACEYALPRGDKTLLGPSVRLAEIIVASYGNIRAGMRVVQNDGRKVVAQGICHDLETNSCVTLEVSRSILQHVWEPDPTRPGKRRKSGRMEVMTEDMQIVTGNAACAIAFRNAVFKIIPAAIVEPIYLRTKEVAQGSIETLPARRGKALEYLHNLGISDEQITLKLNLQHVDDIDLEKLAILRGIANRLKDQEISVAEMFPKKEVKDAAGQGKAATNAATDAIKKAQDKANKTNRRGKKAKPEEKAAGDPAPAATAPAASKADNQRIDPK